MNFKLLEKRSHPELNPRINAIEQLEPYKDRNDVFMTFSTLNKLGLNPINEFDTPTGIYSYAVKDKFDQLKTEGELEFASDRQNCIVFQAKDMSKVLNNNASSSDLKKCLDKVRQKYPQYNKIDDVILYSNWYNLDNTPCDQIESYMLYKEIPTINDMDRIWNLGKNIAVLNADRNHKLNNETWIQNEWSRILMFFGYQGVYDDGEGIIHPNEPAQAVFFQASYVKLICTLNNDFNKVNTNEIDHRTLKRRYEENKIALENLRLLFETKGKLNGTFSIGATKNDYLKIKLQLIRLEDYYGTKQIVNLRFNRIDFTGNKKKALYFYNCKFTAKKGNVYFKNCVFEDCYPENTSNKITLEDCFILRLGSGNFPVIRNIFLKNCTVGFLARIGAKQLTNVINTEFSDNCVIFIKEAEDLILVKNFLNKNSALNCYLYYYKKNDFSTIDENFYFENYDQRELINFGINSEKEYGDKIQNNNFLKKLMIIFKNKQKKSNNPFLIHECLKEMKQ